MERRLSKDRAFPLNEQKLLWDCHFGQSDRRIMEIVIKKQKKKKQYITRDAAKGGGIIRIDEETCGVLEGILDKLDSKISVKELASTLIKATADNAIIKEEEEEE